MNEVDQLNSFLITEYEPEKLMLEAPKKNVFEQIEDSNSAATKAEKEIVNKYIKSEKEKTYTYGSSSSSSSASSYYGSKGYSYGSSSSSRKSPSDDIKDKFNDIRKKAYEDAEKELKASNKTHSKYSKNPQLKSLRKSWLPRIPKSAKPSLKRKGEKKKKFKTAGLVVSIILIQTAAIILRETKENIAREKERDK